MIKREHIKQAIDAISSRDSDIGYSLDEMLGMGLIDIPSSDEAKEGENFFFLFNGDKVLVNRVLFFNEGIVPIEQGLLIKYGELAKKQELQDNGDSRVFRDAFNEIHRFGLRTAVIHEIDYAIARLRKKPGEASSQNQERADLVAFLEKLKENGGAPRIDDDHSMVFYRGVVDTSTAAYFMRFPVTMDSLMQVADINMEFFHLRFILNCLIRGVENNLLACVSEGNIFGLIFLSLKEQAFKNDLEIKYLATLRGKTWDEERPGFKVPKGVGTFLVAGVWLLWKTRMPNLKEIVLNSELGARQFYESVGFAARGFAAYTLREPKGYLLRAILSMTHHSRDLRKETIEEIQNLIRKQIKKLRKKATGGRGASERRAAIESILECLKPEAKREFAEAACNDLIKNRKKIPEFQEMIQFAMEHASEDMKACIAHATGSYR
jgi:hypothetical protein